MAIYALIDQNGIVDNVCEWDGEAPFDPPGMTVTPMASLPADLWIGWRRDANGDWQPPPQPD
jgi:hypothetical protein